MNKFQMSVVDCHNSLTKDYEALMKTVWSDDFEEDFHGENIASHGDNKDFEMYIVHKEGKVLGGAVLSERNYLNSFQDPDKNNKKSSMLRNNIKNLTYLIVDESARGLGIGSLIVKKILERNQRVWLACRDELIPYYESLGFRVSIKRCNNEKGSLLVRDIT